MLRDSYTKAFFFFNWSYIRLWREILLKKLLMVRIKLSAYLNCAQITKWSSCDLIDKSQRHYNQREENTASVFLKHIHLNIYSYFN